MKSAAAISDVSGELFAKTAAHVIEHDLTDRDTIFAAMTKAANAVGEPGESAAVRFTKAYSGRDARIDGTLLSAFNRLEQVAKLGAGARIPLRELVQTGSEDTDDAQPRPRYAMPRVSPSTNSSQVRGAKAGDESPDADNMEACPGGVEDTDETAHSNAGDFEGERFRLVIDAVKRSHPELNTSQAIDVALRDAPARMALRKSLARSREANRTHG
jgi:hypothetical protein